MNVAILKPRFMRPTVRILAELLTQKGHNIHDRLLPDTDAIICYGFFSQILTDRTDTLNARAGERNKFTELCCLRRNDIPTPNVYTAPLDDDDVYPILGRRTKHRGGRDIHIAQNLYEARRLLRNGRADYFTQLVNVKREWRTWIYRRHHLATYEKVLTRPEQNTRFGRNYANGYLFSLRQVGTFPTLVGVHAARAVAALSLDFGGVDVVETVDGHILVLEVNSAPGILGDKRRAINRLARRINGWLTHGQPPQREWRVGDENDVYRWDCETPEVQDAE